MREDNVDEEMKKIIDLESCGWIARTGDLRETYDRLTRCHFDARLSPRGSKHDDGTLETKWLRRSRYVHKKKTFFFNCGRGINKNPYCRSARC